MKLPPRCSTVFDAHAWMWGVLDDWGKPKSPPEFVDEIRAVMADTAVLLNGGFVLDQANMLGGDAKGFALSISHYGQRPLENAELELVVDGERVESWPKINAECGTLVKAGSCTWKAPTVKAPHRVSLHAVLRAGGQETARQNWRCWVFPPPVKTPLALDVQMKEQAQFHAQTARTLQGLAAGGQTKVLVTDDPAKADAQIARGERALLLLGPSKAKQEKEVKFADGDQEKAHPYWNYVGQPGCPSDWAPGRPIHGHHYTVIEPHPILQGLPQDGWAEECFWRAARTKAINSPPRAPFGEGWSARIDTLAGLKPVIATVPGQIENKPCLGAWLAVKQHDSGGRLVLSTLDLAESDPLGAWLAGRILAWLNEGGRP